MILMLDSTRKGELSVGLRNGRLRVLRRTFDGPSRGQLLNIIDELLQAQRATVHDCTGIVVAAGPGPFSALRTACALANALSFVLNVPTVGVRGEMTMKQLAEKGSKQLARAKLGVSVVPFYGKRPNISKSKSR